MKVHRKDLPRLFAPLAKRVANIQDVLKLCAKRNCEECELQKTSCYIVLKQRIDETGRLFNEVRNGVKKMD